MCPGPEWMVAERRSGPCRTPARERQTPGLVILVVPRRADPSNATRSHATQVYYPRRALGRSSRRLRAAELLGFGQTLLGEPVGAHRGPQGRMLSLDQVL
jgi:hypothetical protein